MTHPLEALLTASDRFVLIGDSSEARFPATSYNAYTKVGKPFYCLDLGGLTESRGRLKGGRVYPSVAELPDDHSDLAILWMKPRSAVRGVEAAHEAGCTRVWFSFKTGHSSAVARARELGMEVVEVGRCPIYFLNAPGLPIECKLHVLGVKGSGLRSKQPFTEADVSRREMI